MLLPNFGGSWMVKSTDDPFVRTSVVVPVLPRVGTRKDGCGDVQRVRRRTSSRTSVPVVTGPCPDPRGYLLRGTSAYRRPVAGNPLTGLPGMAENLERVEASLAESVQADDDFLTEVASHLIKAGGKRV